MTRPRPARLTPEQQALASDPRYLRLATDIAGRFARNYPALAEEFRSDSLLALCQAARTFEPARRISFYTHVVNRINGAMLDVCRREGGLKGYRRRDAGHTPSIESLDAIKAEGDVGRTASLQDELSSVQDPVGWEAEYQDELKGFTRCLPARHRAVLRLLHGHAELAKMRETGRAVGLSESRVSQVHSEAVQMLRG